MSYSVGQIVYLLSKKDLKVFPAQVIEEIKRKTLTGETVSYIVTLPDRDRSEVSLDDLSVESFTSIDAVKGIMISNAKSQIESILERAQDVSKIFDTQPLIEPEDVAGTAAPVLHTAPDDESVVKIDLGNGQMGRVDMSEMGG